MKKMENKIKRRSQLCRLWKIMLIKVINKISKIKMNK